MIVAVRIQLGIILRPFAGLHPWTIGILYMVCALGTLGCRAQPGVNSCSIPHSFLFCALVRRDRTLQSEFKIAENLETLLSLYRENISFAFILMQPSGSSSPLAVKYIIDFADLKRPMTVIVGLCFSA